MRKRDKKSKDKNIEEPIDWEMIDYSVSELESIYDESINTYKK